MKNLLKLVIAFTFILSLTGCEEDADNQAAAAQKCLNDLKGSGSASDADACLAKIGSSTDVRVLRVKCALTFISYGITQSTMITAFKALQSNPGTGSPLLNLANGIAVPPAKDADALVAICEQSKSVALTMIANAAKLGKLAQAAAGGATDITTVAGAVGGMSAAAVGEIAVSIADTYCAGEKSDPVCNAIGNAYTVAGCAEGNTVCIGTYLKDTCLGNSTCK